MEKVEQQELAFPLLSQWDDSKLNGMTLRDWFAGMAITGKADHQGCHPGFIEDAYRIADAMLNARSLNDGKE